MFKYKVINSKAGIRTIIETSLDVKAAIPIDPEKEFTTGTDGKQYAHYRHRNTVMDKRTKLLQKEVARILGLDQLPPRTTIRGIK